MTFHRDRYMRTYAVRACMQKHTAVTSLLSLRVNLNTFLHEMVKVCPTRPSLKHLALSLTISKKSVNYVNTYF